MDFAPTMQASAFKSCSVNVDGFACAGFLAETFGVGPSLWWEWRWLHKDIGLKARHWECFRGPAVQGTFGVCGVDNSNGEAMGRMAHVCQELLCSSKGVAGLFAHSVRTVQFAIVVRSGAFDKRLRVCQLVARG